MGDAEIVDLYLKRDEAAIAHSVEKYGARLRVIANSILEDSTAAEECESDTYLAAWNSIPPHEPRTYLFAFLARIARNLSLDRCRHRNRHKRSAPLVALTAELEACIPTPLDTERHVESAELGRAVSAFLRALPEARRNVFLRRYWYFDSVSAIAGRFAMSESKVKSMLFRTRNELRVYLSAEGYAV